VEYSVEDLIEQLIDHEGLKLEPYECTAGKLTIGVGLVSMLDAVRQRVLVDMGFNLGTPTLMKFQKMWDAIEDEDWVEASEQMLDSRWAKQVGRRAERLSQAMSTGEWV